MLLVGQSRGGNDCNKVDTSKFNICLDLKSESGRYESWMDAFALARDRDRWQSIVTDDGDPPVEIRPYIPAEDIATALPHKVDDLYIAAVVVPIDGPGGILGMAGPTVTKNSNGKKVRPLVGLMQFDKDDIDFMREDEWRAVILHDVCVFFQDFTGNPKGFDQSLTSDSPFHSV